MKQAGEFVAYFLYNSETIFSTEAYSSKAAAKSAIDAVLRNGPSAEVFDLSGSDRLDIEDINQSINNTDWVCLAKGISNQDLALIQKRSKDLLASIIQSDADARTKADACKRVEAIIVLLEAPDVPWRQVIELLNHPAVTAFLAAVSLLQFILGMA
ncbi:MAG: YegP family protein [Novosphingobium meiothermophilum]